MSRLGVVGSSVRPPAAVGSAAESAGTREDAFVLHEARSRFVRSPWFALLSIIVCSTVLRAALGLGRPGPWILPDELLYAELARAVADGGLPAVRGEVTLGWGVVYPVLIAPAWLLLDDPTHAYRAALGVNALVMSLAAVPAYLFARLLVPARTAVLVAGGAALVPSMALTTTVMTEVAAYPLFLLTLWLIARVVRAPTVAGQAAAFGVIALLGATRVQGLVLVPVLIMAVALYAALSPAGSAGAYLRRLWPTWVLLGAGAAAALVALVAGGDRGLFGQRSGTLQYVRVGDTSRLLAYFFGDLILYVAVLPVLATTVVVLAGLRRRAAERERLYASVALPTLLAVLGSAAAVSSTYRIDGSEDVNERYVFYAAPVLLTGLALWLDAGLRRPRWAAVVVVTCALLAAALPFDRLEVDASFYAPALAPWVALSPDRVGSGLVVVAFVLALGVVWLRCSVAGARWLWAPVLSVMAVLGLTTLTAFESHADTARAALGEPVRDWVDRAVPPGADVVVLWDQRSSAASGEAAQRAGGLPGLYYVLMLTEFNNESIRRMFRIGGLPSYGNVLPAIRARPGADGSIVDAAGQPIVARFVLGTCDIGVRGQPIGRSSDGSWYLVRTGAPLSFGEQRSCDPRSVSSVSTVHRPLDADDPAARG